MKEKNLIDQRLAEIIVIRNSYYIVYEPRKYDQN